MKGRAEGEGGTRQQRGRCMRGRGSGDEAVVEEEEEVAGATSVR